MGEMPVTGKHGRITTHVLDTKAGGPAAGLAFVLRRKGETGWQELGRFVTDPDGRPAAPLLEGPAMGAGLYEILFDVAAWRAAQGGGGPGDGGFYDTIPIRFRIADPGAHYHVPLILAPFGYSTYRGS